MDKGKFISAIKLLKESVFSIPTNFVDAKLNDGVTIIRYDAEKLDIGVAVLAVTEQGAIAIPDGDYTLEDGTDFTISGGVVSAIKSLEPEIGMQNPGPKTPASAMTETNAKSIIESIIKESRFITEDFLTEKLKELNSQKESFATQKTESDKKVSDLGLEIAAQKETIKQMFSLLEAVAGEPSAPPAEPKKAFDVKEWKKTYKEDLQNLYKKTN